jgi:hypothetical protein
MQIIIVLEYLCVINTWVHDDSAVENRVVGSGKY